MNSTRLAMNIGIKKVDIGNKILNPTVRDMGTKKPKQMIIMSSLHPMKIAQIIRTLDWMTRKGEVEGDSVVRGYC